jgi:general secretion pathway protein A
MYEEYYGFVQPPFSLTPDPRFLYRSESHDVALQQVWQAIRRKEGFIVLTGDIGTGKTTLCRTILEQFDPTTFTALILNPFLSVEELLREVLLSFGIASKEAVRSGRLASASKHELVRTLHDFLLSLVPLHGSAVLIIDEAQHLSPDVLEEIRILSNLETNEQKLLQILLVGQLNLLDVLHDAKLRQLDQRISIRCLLKPLNREEVEAYITHRLWVARGSTAVTFTPAGIDLVQALSGGVPRMINLICDRALMMGCQAQTEMIGEKAILDGAAALGLKVPPAVQRRGVRRRLAGRWWRAAAIALIVILIPLIIAWLVFVGNPFTFFTDSTPAPQPAPAIATLPAAAALPPPDNLPSLTPPPTNASGYSVLVGSFDDPRDASRVERVLRTQNLPVFAIDVAGRDGAIRRRLFVGRFATRDLASVAQQKVATVFPSARLMRPSEERRPQL